MLWTMRMFDISTELLAADRLFERGDYSANNAVTMSTTCNQERVPCKPNARKTCFKYTAEYPRNNRNAVGQRMFPIQFEPPEISKELI